MKSRASRRNKTSRVISRMVPSNWSQITSMMLLMQHRVTLHKNTDINKSMENKLTQYCDSCRDKTELVVKNRGLILFA